jgi:hypothetical protein
MTPTIRCAFFWAFCFSVLAAPASLAQNIGAETLTNQPTPAVNTTPVCRATINFNLPRTVSDTAALTAPGHRIVHDSNGMSPEGMYHYVWQKVCDDFLWRDQLYNWQSWEHKYDGKLFTVAEAKEAIDKMLASLSDGYTFMYRPPPLAKPQPGLSQGEVEGPVVSFKMLAGTTIGYIQIETFMPHNVAAQTEAALTDLSKQGATAFILDLRNNSGGWLIDSFKVFSLFADSGKYATAKGWFDGKWFTEEFVLSDKGLEENGDNAKSVDAREPDLLGHRPLIILVNDKTASASEMLAGALRVNIKARLLGAKTFGKGIAQLHIFDVPFQSEMQITYEYLFQPDGNCIYKTGLHPDILVGASHTAGGDAQLEAAKTALTQAQPPAN